MHTHKHTFVIVVACTSICIHIKRKTFTFKKCLCSKPLHNICFRSKSHKEIKKRKYKFAKFMTGCSTKNKESHINWATQLTIAIRWSIVFWLRAEKCKEIHLNNDWYFTLGKNSKWRILAFQQSSKLLTSHESNSAEPRVTKSSRKCLENSVSLICVNSLFSCTISSQMLLERRLQPMQRGSWGLSVPAQGTLMTYKTIRLGTHLKCSNAVNGHNELLFTSPHHPKRLINILVISFT